MTIITAQEKRDILMSTVRSLNAMKNGNRKRKYFRLFATIPDGHKMRLLDKGNNQCEVVV